MDKTQNPSDIFAKTFLDMWQEQLTGLMKDPEAISQMLKQFSHMLEVQRRNFSNSVYSGNEEERGTTPHEPSASTNADVLAFCCNELSKLHAGIACLEERITRLESTRPVTRSRKKTPA